MQNVIVLGIQQYLAKPHFFYSSIQKLYLYLHLKNTPRKMSRNLFIHMDIDHSIICNSKRLKVTSVSLRGYCLNKPGNVLLVEYYVAIKRNKEYFYTITLQNISLSDKSKRQNVGKNANMHVCMHILSYDHYKCNNQTFLSS